STGSGRSSFEGGSGSASASTTPRRPTRPSATSSRGSPMNDFKERRQARIERLRERAARKLSERAAAHAQVDQLADIMSGQPILVGHHSERRHRRDLERMSANMRKASALNSEDEELRRRADAAERNRAIFSDDPEAVRKLR